MRSPKIRDSSQFDKDPHDGQATNFRIPFEISSLDLENPLANPPDDDQTLSGPMDPYDHFKTNPDPAQTKPERAGPPDQSKIRSNDPDQSKSNKPMDVDDILEKIKPLGRYQILLTLLYMYAMFPLSVNNGFMAFDDPDPKFLCSDDPASNASTIPTDDCRVYHDCTPKNLTFVVTFYSVAHQFGLICGREYYVNLITTIQMAGDLFGALIIGYISDTYGRKPTFIIVMTTQVVLGSLSCLSPSWPVFAAFRFLIGCCAGAEMVAGWVLVAEWTTNRYRYLIRAVAAATLSNLDQVLVAYLTKNWKWFALAGNLQAVPLLVMLVFFIHESPRWLLQKGRTSEAEAILRKIAAINRTSANLPEKLYLNGPSTTTTRARPWHLFQTRRLATYTVVCVVSWFLICTVNYGMYFNTSYLPANIYLSMTILGVTGMLEVPVAMCDAYYPNMNRRWTLLIGMGFVICCLTAMVALLGAPGASTIAGYSAIVAVVNVIGQLAVNVVFDQAYVYAIELFPTLLRSTAGSLCSVGARVGAVIAPQVIYSSHVWPAAPYALFGVFAVIMTVIDFLFLPNTKKMHLPDSVKDVVNSAAVN